MPLSEDKLFEGIEREGVHRGMLTLFVQGRVPCTEVYRALHLAKYKQVYFGARLQPSAIVGPSDVSLDTVLAVRYTFPSLIVTIETIEALMLELLYNVPVRFMLPVYDRGLRCSSTALAAALRNPTAVQIKFSDGDTVRVASLAMFYVNKFSEYSEDKPL